MIEQAWYRRATEKLGFRQKSYQQAFGVEGSPANLALVDLADYCGAFRSDLAGLTNEQLREMNGRRQAFFRVWTHLKLSPIEMELVCKQVLVRAASRLSQIEAGD
jgi:hypothetical protein